MPFWNRSDNGVTNEQRLAVLDLATDEDFSLDEVARKLGSVELARTVVDDLRRQGMVEFFWKKPKGDRDLIDTADVDHLLVEDTEWLRRKSFVEPYVIVVANDKGWRWHQTRWKAN
jgi:hypothetical protein